MSLTNSLCELRIILVEPSGSQARHIQRMLEQMGAGEVILCQSGAEALQLIPEGIPPLVISSLYLPDMEGTELVALMRRDERMDSTPFILISSETRPQVLDPIRQSGACSIITKPFTEKQLERALFAAADYLIPPSDVDIEDIENLRVLMVDDSTASRRHMRRLLEEQGIERIFEAANGKEAIARLQDTTVDLVITDYNMPEMDGHELTAYIRTQSWQSTVPILMVTSESNMGRLAAVEKAGVSMICDKPFDASSIFRLMADSLRNY